MSTYVNGVYLSPQAIKVLKTLEKGGSISTAQAEHRGIGNLSARICNLRDAGYDIETKPLKTAGSKASKYVLA